MSISSTFGPPGPAEPPRTSAELWGLLCHVHSGEARCSVPEGFHEPAANRAAALYAQAIARELARLPHRYGYDPQARYAAHVQTSDSARADFPSLAFGRDAQGQAAVRLIPDVYYLDTDGYAHLRHYGLWAPDWTVRSRDLVWRGSVTGRSPSVDPLDIPRVRLAWLCRDRAGCNVGLIGVHETMPEPREPLQAFIAAERLRAQAWRPHEFAYHRLVVDIDGHANAWGLLEKLILGCCVLKVATPYEQWFYPRLHAWEHYVPIAADLSDLHEAVDWCRENDAQCEWIAANGRRLARTLAPAAVLAESCLAFMSVAQASRGYPLSASACRAASAAR